ncbi:CheR family methyltransferase [Burkholderiaceae bacterium UC74_6]
MISDPGLLDISDADFARFRSFLFETAGIVLGDNKKALVSGRLMKRLRQLNCRSYGEYLALLGKPDAGAEAQVVVDLLTTNETYFFREMAHFDFLRNLAEQARLQRRALRVWSAACASGEEAYSIAMTLDDAQRGLAWQVQASDISSRMLARARAGHYPESRTSHTPPHYRQAYCLRGTGPHTGTLLVDKQLRQRVEFSQINLNRPLPSGLGEFDVIFLRNVMIYFNSDTKRQVVQRLALQLRRGGHVLVGHSETLSEHSADFEIVAPSVYRKR